jgi:hypothetical protein
MPAMPEKPATTPIPVQLSESEFTQFILPHLTMPKRGPRCKLGYHRVFNLILWVLYTGMQWKSLPVPKDTHGNAAIHYTTVYKVGSSSFLVNTAWAFYPPCWGSARSGPAGSSSGPCDPSIPLQRPGASASSPPASPKLMMTQFPLHRRIETPAARGRDQETALQCVLGVGAREHPAPQTWPGTVSTSMPRWPAPLIACQTPRHPGLGRADTPHRRRCLSIVIASEANEGGDGLGVRPLFTRRSIGATAGNQRRSRERNQGDVTRLSNTFLPKSYPPAHTRLYPHVRAVRRTDVRHPHSFTSD